jgi:hypothetical protein
MELCRQLADQGHLVIVTADVTRSLEMCDRVLVIAGGTMVFYAPPRYLTTFFQVSEPGDLYEQLGEPSRWASAYKASRLFVRYLVPSMRHGRTPPLPPSGDLGGWARQLSVLTRRYLSVLAGDNRNLAFMGLQAPLIAVVIALVFPGDAFSSISAMKSAPALLLALVIAALWFGTSNAAREIVKERNVYLRERMVGLNVGAYVLSKILPLCALGALQAAILTVILGIHTNWFGDQSFGAVLTVWLLLTLAVASGTALGLVISAFARSPNQAISLTPVVLLPQLVFSGLFIALEEGSHLMKVLTNLAVSNWCFGALGKALDLNAMFGKSITLAPLGRAIFQRSLGTSVLVLVAMAALLTSIAWFALSFKRD